MPEILGTSKSIWGFDPRIIPGCCIWLDGADSNSTANINTTWIDKSVYGSNATPTASVYSMGTINSLPAVSFPTSNTNYFTFGTTGTSDVNGVSFFFVAKVRGQSAYGGRFLCSSGGDVQIYQASVAIGNTNVLPAYVVSYAGSTSMTTGMQISAQTPFMYSGILNSSTFSEWVDGTANTTTAAVASNTWTSWALGNYPGGYSGYETYGYIGEVIMYNRELTTAQREIVEGYLAWKWSLQSNLPLAHTYYSIKPFAQTFTPSNIAGLYIWLDGADMSTMDPATPSSGTRMRKWKDKLHPSTYQFTPGAVSNEAYQASGQTLTVAGPTYVTGGGVSFNNPSQYAYAGECLGIWSSLYAPLFTVPTQSMSLVVASYPLSNDALRRICQLGTYPISSPPNFILGPEMGRGEGGSMLYDLSGGTWNQLNYNDGVDTITYPYNSNTAPRVDVMISAPGATEWWWTNGVLNTFSASNVYTSTQSNYPVSFFFMGGYTNTIDGGRPFHGTIYEVMFFSNALTTGEREQIEGYLAWKWNFNTSLDSNHPFSKFPPNTVVP